MKRINRWTNASDPTPGLEPEDIRSLPGPIELALLTMVGLVLGLVFGGPGWVVAAGVSGLTGVKFSVPFASLAFGLPAFSLAFYGPPFGHRVRLGELPEKCAEWPLEVRKALDQAEWLLSNPDMGRLLGRRRYKQAISRLKGLLPTGNEASDSHIVVQLLYCDLLIGVTNLT